MSYLRVNKNGTTTPMGEIVGYRVLYKDQKGTKKKSKPFLYFWQANQFKQHLPLGSSGIVIPQYQGDTGKVQLNSA